MSEHAHENSVYTRCLACCKWGVNLPGIVECGNCGSKETVLYRPPCCFAQAHELIGRLVEAAERIESQRGVIHTGLVLNKNTGLDYFKETIVLLRAAHTEARAYLEKGK